MIVYKELLLFNTKNHHNSNKGFLNKNLYENMWLGINY